MNLLLSVSDSELAVSENMPFKVVLTVELTNVVELGCFYGQWLVFVGWEFGFSLRC